jgi:aminoglycoside phosphotransferase (APT) family kinase protein
LDSAVDLDLDRLAGVLSRAFPGLEGSRPVSVLGRGFRSIALETDGGLVIRIGLSADAAGDHGREWRIGGFLNAAFGDLVPRPIALASASPGLPHGAIAYKKLPGETPPRGVDPGDPFADDLAEFMARLHRLPVDAAKAAGLPEVDAFGRILGAREVVKPVLVKELEAHAFDRVASWWEGFAADEEMRSRRLAVCHHDLWHDNLLRSSEGRLSGVLDLAHVELSDPAHDFAAPRYFGERFFERLVTAYGRAGAALGEGDLYRARRYYEAREFGGLAWAIEHDDRDEVEDSVRKLLEGPIFRSA